MIATISSFSSLYFATLLMLIGTGLFNTYMGLRLTSQAVSEVWIGALIAGYYFGLVCGARLGHRLIIRVGHIRAFVACAAVATSMILAQTLVDSLPLWLAFRVISGIVMVTEFMVIESWLNEQTENHQRGRVFSVYMVVSGLGTVLGQLALTAYATLDLRPLTLVAMCLVLCLVPIAVTARSHPPTPLPAPLDIRFFLRRVPLSMTVLFVAGNVSGAFYGLAAVYGAKHGMSTSQAAVFVATAVTAGLLSQWPMGWLSDRINRAGLIRFNALLLAVLPALMWAGSNCRSGPCWPCPPYSACSSHAVPAGRGLRQRPCGIRAARQPVGGAADDLRRRRLRRPHDRGRADVLGRAQHVLHVRIGLLADPGLAGAADARHGRAPGAGSAHPLRADAGYPAKLARVGGAGSPVDPETDITIEMVEPDPATAAVQSVDPVAAEAVVAGAAPAAAAAPGAAVSEAAADHPAAAEAARDMGYEAGRVPDAKDLDEEAPEPRLRTGT